MAASSNKSVRIAFVRPEPQALVGARARQLLIGMRR